MRFIRARRMFAQQARKVQKRIKVEQRKNRNVAGIGGSGLRADAAMDSRARMCSAEGIGEDTLRREGGRDDARRVID